MTIRLSDLLTIGEWVLASENLRLRTALSRQVIELPRQLAASDDAELIPRSFGEVCGAYDGGLLGHNGSVLGQTVALRMDMARASVFVVGINAWAPHVRDRAISMISGAADNSLCAASAKSGPFSLEDLAGGFSLSDLLGTYDGAYARQVCVEDGGGGVVHLRVGVDGPRQRRVRLLYRGAGAWQFDPPQNLSCSFTPNPEDDSPVLHLGVHSYRQRQR